MGDVYPVEYGCRGRICKRGSSDMGSEWPDFMLGRIVVSSIDFADGGGCKELVCEWREL
jgi:hypothetical protein